MQRYVVSRFDGSTFVVIDQTEKREVCVCSNYDDWDDARERAERIVRLLNGASADNGAGSSWKSTEVDWRK